LYFLSWILAYHVVLLHTLHRKVELAFLYNQLLYSQLRELLYSQLTVKAKQLKYNYFNNLQCRMTFSGNIRCAEAISAHNILTNLNDS